jgi:hypothetical protein
MKSIANQYKDLKEGKMSQANFMRNLRMSMPQVTNVMSFGDAVKVLKNKGIITESHLEEEITTDKEKDNRYNSLVSTNRGEDKDFAKLSRDEKEKMMYADTDPNIADPINDSDTEFDAILKQLEDEMAGEEAVKGQYDLEEGPEEEVEKAIQAKKIDPAVVKTAAEKAMRGDSTDLALLMVNAGNLTEAKETTNPNKVHPQEYTMGIKYELKCFKGDVVKAERAVLKNLAKEPFYYTALKLSGKDIYKEAPSVKAEAPKKKSKKKEAELVDTINAMQKVKMPKAEEKKKLKENVDKKMRFQDLPADSEKYKIVRDSKNYIIKATNADGVEFQKGDDVKINDGEEIKIVKFEENQGKVKAIYSNGMLFVGIDINDLKAGKPEFRPGVDMGKSFEKFKSKLAEMVKKALSEEVPSKQIAASEITAKAVEYIDDYNEGEKTYKKSQLENVFDSYEDKVGHRFDDSVFEDVIDMLKVKGYTMTMKEMFDGRDNLTDISDDTK